MNSNSISHRRRRALLKLLSVMETQLIEGRYDGKGMALLHHCVSQAMPGEYDPKAICNTLIQLGVISLSRHELQQPTGKLDTESLVKAIYDAERWAADQALEQV